MPDRSFVGCWSLDVDDAGFVKGFNLDSRTWVAFQHRYFRADNPCGPFEPDLDERIDSERGAACASFRV